MFKRRILLKIIGYSYNLTSNYIERSLFFSLSNKIGATITIVGHHRSPNDVIKGLQYFSEHKKFQLWQICSPLMLLVRSFWENKLNKCTYIIYLKLQLLISCTYGSKTIIEYITYMILKMETNLNFYYIRI